ncbi:prokaryotic membrane lipoprotein lipid attachment site profile [Desulfoluna spongiiphila]|nr:prokaryotic membrane lipoprotein lipid attachment site profile [Desulfoluna spongiiphila]
MGTGMKNGFKRDARRVMWVLVALVLVACDKEPPERDMIVGPWKDTIASYHTIISFRSNGSFGIIRLVEGQHSKIDEKAERVKVDGKWKLLPPEMEGDPLLLIMTPEMVVGDTPWAVDTPVTYLIERLTRNSMLLRPSGGERITWDRLRSTKAPEEEDGIPLTQVPTGPLVVGLTKERLNEDNRYLCVQLILTVNDVEGLRYVEPEDTSVGGAPGAYRLHPSLLEALVLHMSRLSYRDVRSLKRFHEVRADFIRILTPYLGSHLQDIKVVKVVVTSTRDGVSEFVGEFAPEKVIAPEAGS